MDIIETILFVAKNQKTFTTSDIVQASKNTVSRQYAARTIRSLLSEGRLVKSGATRRASYALPENAASFGNTIKKRVKNIDLKEHEVLDSLEHPAVVLSGLIENVKSIFTYGFSEMLNNAIEHSKSRFIEIEVNKSENDLIFIIHDFGVGVFKNVMQKRALDSELDAIQEILKGKTTTDPKAHSGEGIFFTSKAGDIFILESFNYRLRVDNRLKDIFVEKLDRSLKGTKVTFVVSLESKKHLTNIFNDYTNPETYAFDKTEIQIKLYTMGTVYISRSQARRVLSGLEKFILVILDFDKVPTVGQAFADEIFRVFKIKHPEIRIEPVNMNEGVRFMVERAEKTQPL